MKTSKKTSILDYIIRLIEAKNLKQIEKIEIQANFAFQIIKALN